METDYRSFDKDLPLRYRKASADDTEASNAPQHSSPVEPQEKVSAESDIDSSSADENYDVQSLTSSIEDQLTWVRVASPTNIDMYYNSHCPVECKAQQHARPRNLKLWIEEWS